MAKGWGGELGHVRGWGRTCDGGRAGLNLRLGGGLGLLALLCLVLGPWVNKISKPILGLRLQKKRVFFLF